MRTRRAGKGRRSKVLVVDDEPDLRELVAVVLETGGYEVETASDGQEALARLSSLPPPDVIVLDLMMPRMDGMALLEAIAGRPELAGLWVLVVSASHDALVEGPRRTLKKPFRVEELLEAVAEGCASSLPGPVAE